MPATKYLNGHSDVIAGALVTAADDDHWNRVKSVRKNLGAVLARSKAWLLLRGMRTLYPRVRTASANALDIAALFRGPSTAWPKSSIPACKATPARNRPQTDDRGFGGMLSIRVSGGTAAAIAAAARQRVLTRATSLGGVESLIEHRATIEGADSPVPAICCACRSESRRSTT